MKPCLRSFLIIGLLVITHEGFGADANLSELAAANNDFAFKLLKQMAREAHVASLFISPYSAATALQIVGTGAAGRTKVEMQQILGTSRLSDTP